MDRDTAVRMAQEAIRARNKSLIDQLIAAGATTGSGPPSSRPVAELPQIAVTCATGWECYAIVEELVHTRRFRVKALYRTPGTEAARRLEDLLQATQAIDPGLLTLESGVDMNAESTLTRAFAGCQGVVLYVTANTSKAGKITNHGNDPVGGRAAVMRQVVAALGALKANPSVSHVVTLVFPPDKVTSIVDEVPEIPWWIDQRLRISNLLRNQGLNVTCIHRPAYYYAMHRVDYTAKEHFRGDSKLSRTMIRENNIPGITEPDFMVNWIDVRDVGKWAGTMFDYPRIFANQDFPIASSAHTAHELVAIAERSSRHGTRFRYKQFPLPLMKLLSLVTEEVVYPLRYAQWYNAAGNGYDFASNDALADLDRIHPRWTFERELEFWGINDIKPARRA